MDEEQLWHRKREVLHSEVHKMLTRGGVRDADLDIMVRLLGYGAWRFPLTFAMDYYALTRLAVLDKIARELKVYIFSSLVEAIHAAMTKTDPPVQRSDFTDEAWAAFGKLVECWNVARKAL